jgi:hypothetical protein
MKKSSLFFLLMLAALCSPAQAQNLPYGVVIGGSSNDEHFRSFLKANEQGIRVTVIQTRGLNSGLAGGGVAQGGGMQVLNLELPTDTDYLELMLLYVNLDPRLIRKSKVSILRIKETGTAPYKSKEVKREWLTYNFKKQYQKGGPFDLLQAGDIVVIEQKGLLNREYFDFLVDVRFLISLPAVLVSSLLLVNALK